MYWYTRYNAKRIDSSALMADAWHHRSDAFSSIGALIGIAGARIRLSYYGFNRQSDNICIYHKGSL